VRAARLSIVVVVVVVCAWFGLGIRQAHDISSATSIVAQTGTIPATELRAAASALQSAQTLDPDDEVAILRGRLAVKEQDPRRAERILKTVVRDEPMNLEAWIWLAGVSLIDPPEARIALAHIARLDPRS
jgi:predicted Zn-dependent protease